MNKKIKRFLSTEQVGMLLGVTRQTVRNWFLKGQIKAYRIGQNIKIPRAEAIRILKHYQQPIPYWLTSKNERENSGNSELSQ
jgi:excisionase family DNA binding protein